MDHARQNQPAANQPQFNDAHAIELIAKMRSRNISLVGEANYAIISDYVCKNDPILLALERRNRRGVTSDENANDVHANEIKK